MEKEIEKSVKKAIKQLLAQDVIYFTFTQELTEFMDVCMEEVLVACECGPVFESDCIRIITDVFASW